MVKATKGFRRETRRKLRKHLSEKFKPESYLTRFSPGEKAVIKPDPYSHKGMPFPKFSGKIGEVVEKRGSAYIMRVKFGNKEKIIISKPEHMRLLKNK